MACGGEVVIDCENIVIVVEREDSIVVTAASQGLPAQNQAPLRFVADEEILAGQPVYCVSTTGHGALCDASFYAKSFCVGLCSNSALQNSVAEVEPERLTILDWTDATGSESLISGAHYFLSEDSGMLTTDSPQTVGSTVTYIGTAVSGSTMLISPQPPILL